MAATLLKALEATAISLYRVASGQSPAANFSPHADRVPEIDGQQQQAGRYWSAGAWRAGSVGRPRGRQCHGVGGVWHRPASRDQRIRAHLAKSRVGGHRQARWFAGNPQTSWVTLPGTAKIHLLEHENRPDRISPVRDRPRTAGPIPGLIRGAAKRSTWHQGYMSLALQTWLQVDQRSAEAPPGTRQ